MFSYPKNPQLVRGFGRRGLVRYSYLRIDRKGNLSECFCVSWTALYLLAAVLLRGTGMCASNAVARLNPVPPCAALVAAAQASKIPLEQIDAQTETDRLDPGDSITGVITMFEKGGRRTQWLLY